MLNKLSLFFAIILFVANVPAKANPDPERCDMDAYLKVIAGCFTGRADGFSLPANLFYSFYSTGFTQSWDLGSYDKLYKGLSFQPAGAKVDPTVSVMPPYMWGAVSQLCDPEFNPDTHPKCVAYMKKMLFCPIMNARYASKQFYWRSHGHNCHDAVEDVGMCLLNASKYMAPHCGFEAKVVVWDAEPDMTKALGNVYHSQLLVKRIRETPTNQQEPVVCLAESQVANPSGLFEDACCSTNLALFEQGTIEDYHHAYVNCSNMFMPANGVYPHLYEVAAFREMRQTGTMDVPNTYNRQAGICALNQNKGGQLGRFAPIPHILSAVYDKKGIPLALNIR